MTISDKHCRTIGKISVAFAEIESWVGFFVWALIGPEQHIGQMVTAEMSFSRQLDLLSSLFQYRCDDPEKLDDLKALILRLTELEQQRNTVLHSLWIRQSSNPSEAARLKITAKRKKGLAHSKEVVKPKQLEAIAGNLQVALSDFSSFMTTFLIHFTYAQTFAAFPKE